jgi:hypothetical protein
MTYETKIQVCKDRSVSLDCPDSLAREWGNHLLIPQVLDVPIDEAASELDWLLCFCFIHDHPMQGQPNKEAFHKMLHIHEYKSSVECFVICRSPELQSTCLIFLDGEDSSNLSLLFKPRVISSLSSSDRGELLCWSLLFLEQFPVSNPDLRFEDRTTLGSNRMQIKIKNLQVCIYVLLVQYMT